jgi:hypothetical protein
MSENADFDLVLTRTDFLYARRGIKRIKSQTQLNLKTGKRTNVKCQNVNMKLGQNLLCNLCNSGE